MKRRIIKIERSLCNGCQACAKVCHEGAIEMIDGKAALVREDYCDGLGDCLPVCPTGAISFEEPASPSCDEQTLRADNATSLPSSHQSCSECACPGVRSLAVERGQPRAKECAAPMHTRLAQWPCQIRLAPINAPYFSGANLLIAADCSAFAYGNFHNDFMKNHITLIGCPKLDAINYAQKLTEIIKNNEVRSVKIVRMEVPCCSGLELAAKKAIMASGKFIPWQVITLSTNGKILD